MMVKLATGQLLFAIDDILLVLKGMQKYFFFVSKQSRHLEIANYIFRKCKLDSFNKQVFGANCLHITSPWNFTILEA